MKKFIVFLMLSVFLMALAVGRTNTDFILPDSEIQFFTNSKPTDSEFAKIVKNGNGYIVCCNYKNYDKVKGMLNGIAGTTFILDGDFEEYKNVLNKLNISVIEHSGTSVVGFTDNFYQSVFYNGKKANVQAYYNNNKIYVGSPLILGSY